MRTTCLSVLVLASASLAQGGPTQDALIERRDAKLEEAWLKTAPWLTDYDAARARAKASGKLIFAYFTRSYAPCGWCRAIERGALSDPALKEFAQDVVLFCHVASKVDGEKHGNLWREKGVVGFPTVMFLDHEGGVLVRERERTVAGFRATLALLSSYDATKRRAETGDAAAKADLLIADLALHRVMSFALARARFEDLEDVPPEKAARLGALLADLQATALVRRAKRKSSRVDLAKEFLAMRAQHRVPRGEHALRFWRTLLDHAAGAGDASLLRALLAECTEIGVPKGLALAGYEKRLAAIK